MRERGERFHYVVAIGFTDEAIVIHDPARGPFRDVNIDRFVRQWRAAGSWALLVLPNATPR
jgi:peptidase C39-like protein